MTIYDGVVKAVYYQQFVIPALEIGVDSGA